MKLLTKCCKAYDTFHGDLHICRQCGQPNPLMFEPAYLVIRDGIQRVDDVLGYEIVGLYKDKDRAESAMKIYEEFYPVFITRRVDWNVYPCNG
jgi:hypothetical protein